MRPKPPGALLCARSLRVLAVMACAAGSAAGCTASPAPTADTEGVGGGDIDPAPEPAPALSPTPTTDPKRVRAERFAAAAAAVAKNLKKKSVAELLKEAKRQETAQNWNDARAAFQAVVLLHPEDAGAPAALEAATRAEKLATNDFLVAINQRLQSDIAYLLRMEPGVQTPEETLQKMVVGGIAKARSYGMTWESTLISYVVIMFVSAPNFEENIYIQSVLSDEHEIPDRRIDCLWINTNDEIWDEIIKNYEPNCWE